jgi:ubiquinol-cytochrome c reductase subunit 7
VNMASQAARVATAKALPAWQLALKKWAYNLSYFNQLGLMHDDTLHQTEEVKEALRRLPKNVQDDRQHRITRALYLSMRKEVLPKQEWTKFEEDIKYLQPYLEEVEREFAEREEWNKK